MEENMLRVYLKAASKERFGVDFNGVHACFASADEVISYASGLAYEGGTVSSNVGIEVCRRLLRDLSRPGAEIEQAD